MKNFTIIRATADEAASATLKFANGDEHATFATPSLRASLVEKSAFDDANDGNRKICFVLAGIIKLFGPITVPERKHVPLAAGVGTSLHDVEAIISDTKTAQILGVLN
jgi:hypothetical protein